MDDKRHEEQNKVSRSFNLDQENLAWLEKVNEGSGRRSVSNVLNHLLTQLRLGKAGKAVDFNG